MTQTRSFVVHLAGAAALALAVAAVAAACGPDLVFRAYLSRTLWHPAYRVVSELALGLPPERPDHTPYAGMSRASGSPSAQEARDAYRALFPDPPPPHYYYSNALNWPDATITHLRDVLNRAQPGDSAEADELQLLQCKVELRGAKPDDGAALAHVRSCLESYLGRPRPDNLASEAHGWMARVDFLDRHPARAAKFYLDELRSPSSNIPRERLLASLDQIQPALADLDDYFDTPGHALFVATRITNDTANDALEAPLVERLERRQSLFGRGDDSDALAVALMRASTRMGTPDATLRYAERIPSNAAARGSAEYNWLLGAALYQRSDYAGAAAAFNAALTTRDADAEHQVLASNGLIGAYHKLNRPLDELWAAFERASVVAGSDGQDGFDSFDAGYLIDVQLSDAQLEEFLRRFPSAAALTFQRSPQAQSAADAVRYALAVRRARREDYAGAARLYDAVHSNRASTMREAGRLFDATRAGGNPSSDHWRALFDYAAFLADHEDGLFFNDTLWNGFQTQAFVYRNPDMQAPDFGLALANFNALSDAERAGYAQRERRLRDDQEEYWRAYKILNDIVAANGATPLGKQAAALAVRCLRKINADRFGRRPEIRAADVRLSAWLARNSSP